MGYDQYTFTDTVAVEPTFVAFLFAVANICPWPLVSFVQIPLKNSELKTTHNTLRDCRVNFFRQPFSKQLYKQSRIVAGNETQTRISCLQARSKMLCAVDYIFNLLCTFNCLQPMKKFVFSVASRATGRLQIKPSGSGDENVSGPISAVAVRENV